jgi:DNA glycosylase AlkZ-like
MGTGERRARLGARHLLARPAGSIDEAAEAMVALHSSDPATVFLSARARVRAFAPEDLEDALYARRALVRMLGMRRTLFVVPRDLAAVMDAACTKALIPAQRTRLIRILEEQGVALDGAAWLRRVSRRTLKALDEAGEASAIELTRAVPELGIKLRFGEGKSWGGTMGVSTRVLFLLATEGRVVRVRPQGRWTSGRYRWTRTERWLDGPLPQIPHSEARSDLLGRFLRAFGPATLTDISWWTGWTRRLATTTLRELEAAEIQLEDGVGYVLPDDLETVRTPRPWVALLPALDPTVMGWKERSWYLGANAEALFDRNGNAGPTVWADGRAIGGWSQAEDGEIRMRLLEPVGIDVERMLEAERDRLGAWFGDVRIKPRFRTPLERELSA